MGTQETLFLHEEIMLLALQDEKGTVAWGTYATNMRSVERSWRSCC